MYRDENGVIHSRKLEKITQKYKFPNKQLEKFRHMRIHGKEYFTYYMYNRARNEYYLPKASINLVNEFDLEDYYTLDETPIDIEAQGLSLRPQQQKLLDDLGDDRFALFKARTGFGKSYVIGGLVDKFKLKTLIVVPKIEIAKGLNAKLSEIFPDKVIVFKGKEMKVGPVTIIVSASFRKYWKDLHGHFDMLVFDEAHMDIFGDERIKALCLMHYTRLYGLTATPERDEIDGKYFEHIYGPIIEADQDKSIEPYIITKEYSGDFNESWQHWSEFTESLVYNDDRTVDMAYTIIETMSHQSRNMGIVFVDRIETAERIHRILEAVGFPSATYTSKTQDRDAILADIEQKRGVIVATYQTVGVGFDYTALDTGFFYMNIKFQGTVKQAVGRILRKNTDDHFPILINWTDETLSLRVQIRERMRAFKTAFLCTQYLPYNTMQLWRKDTLRLNMTMEEYTEVALSTLRKYDFQKIKNEKMKFKI